MIPKEGANAFRGMFFTTFTHPNLQANNLDEQQNRGWPQGPQPGR